MSLGCSKKTCCCCFSLKTYKARWVLLWPIVLILMQNVVVSLSATVFGQMKANFDLLSSVTDGLVYNNVHSYGTFYILGVILLWSTAGFVSAWLVGWKCKLMDIVVIGLVIVSVGVLIKSILSVIVVTVNSPVIQSILLDIGYFFSMVVVVGMGFVANNTLQLAMEQIPEASSDQLSSLVSWFVFSSSLGWWFQASIRDIYRECVGPSENAIMEYDPVVKLVVCCLCAFSLILNFLFKHKLLDNSLTSSDICKVYLVLKYAYKHKFPQKRSALTYWKDAPYSRLSLSKNDYGGPFTNEQVEDVKTFIRISVVFVGVTLYLLCLYFNSFSLYYVDNFPGSNHSLQIKNLQYSCGNTIMYYLSCHYTWWMVVFVLFYELVLIPVLSYRMPNMFRRLSLAAVGIFPIAVSNAVMVMINRYSNKYIVISLMPYQIGISMTVGFIKALFFITSLELICAQAPYSMRNYFISVAQTIGWSCPMLAPVIFEGWKYICSGRDCAIPYTLLTLAWCAAGLIIGLVFVKKYRMRSRGEEGEQNRHKWVEEVYGRYVNENSADFFRQSLGNN